MAKKNLDASTEEKIIEAARKVFTQKGYAATRTRDIAEEAGLNLALLNYYFRSKEKLFGLVMSEKIGQLFGIITPIVNDDKTSLEEKIALIVPAYLNVLSENPGLPLFVLSEIRNNPEHFNNKVQAGKLLSQSSLVKQLLAKRPEINPLHFILNLMGMCIFPFITKPVFQASGLLNEASFAQLIEERKIFIVKWVDLMLEH